MTDFFIKLLNMSISAGWVILAVIILRLVFAKAPKQLRILMWVLPALRLVCPFSFKSVFSLIPSANTVDPSIMLDKTPTVDTGIGVLNDVVNPVIAGSFTPAVSDSANPLQIIIPVLANLWFIVLVGFAVYTVVSGFVLTVRLGSAVKLRDNVYQSDRINSPFVFGVPFPRIYVPFSLSGKELEAVVMHENAHIERCDHIIKPAAFFILVLHWFNPLVWLAYVLFCRDVELACDERVIRTLDDNGKADYSQALLSCTSGHRIITSSPLAFGEVGVKARVKSVLGYRKPALWVIICAVIAVVVIAVLFMTDPIVIDIADYNWQFSHVKHDDEYVYASPERAHLYGIEEYKDIRVSVDGDKLYFAEPELNDYRTFDLELENRTPYYTLYTMKNSSFDGYAVVSDLKSDADMSGGMMIIGSGEVSFGVPTNEITLIITDGITEIYFYHDKKAPKYDPFSAETMPVTTTVIAEHISDEKLSFEELSEQSNRMWDYVKNGRKDKHDPGLAEWAEKIESVWCDNGQNYVTVTVRDFTENNLLRFAKAFTECSYVIEQIN